MARRIAAGRKAALELLEELVAIPSVNPPGEHYEETNSAGWDVVLDLWAAAQRLFDSQ